MPDHDLTSRELMRRAMRREPTERIPTMPQICHDAPVRIYAEEDGIDWIDGVRRCVEDPTAIYDYVIRLVRQIGCDGLRLFVKPEPMKVARDGDQLIVLDEETEARIGRIDLHGGGGFVPDRPEPPVETLEEARLRLDETVRAYSDEKMDLLRQARERVSDLFAAGAPGNFTIGMYNILRGREQGMIDLIERPEFVCAVLDVATDAAIQRAEKLLATGVDVFYIGDPSSSSDLISPKHWEKFCLPAFQKFCNHFKNVDILIYIHICGNSNPILEMMADTGAHVVEPLDPLGGVSVADAKRRIGGRVALMGGVNTITLARGSADEVKAEAIQKCREGGPYGYVLAAGDMVPPDTPLENLQALVDVARYSQWK